MDVKDWFDFDRAETEIWYAVYTGARQFEAPDKGLLNGRRPTLLGQSRYEKCRPHVSLGTVYPSPLRPGGPRLTTMGPTDRKLR